METRGVRLTRVGALVAFPLALALLAVIIGGCSSESTGPAVPQTDAGYSAALKAPAVDVNPDPPKVKNQFGLGPVVELVSWSSVMGGAPNCVYYEYDGEGAMSLTHTYTANTCCAFDMWIEFAFEDGVITIAEFDQPGFYMTLSRYELAMEITRLRPGTYTFIFTNRYLAEPLEFTVDLIAQPSGTYCD